MSVNSISVPKVNAQLTTVTPENFRQISTDVCPPCREGFEVGQEVGSHDGMHFVHRPCFNNWARQSNPVTCPTCRAEITNGHSFLSIREKLTSLMERVSAFVSNEELRPFFNLWMFMLGTATFVSGLTAVAKDLGFEESAVAVLERGALGLIGSALGDVYAKHLITKQVAGQFFFISGKTIELGSSLISRISAAMTRETVSENQMNPNMDWAERYTVLSQSDTMLLSLPALQARGIFNCISKTLLGLNIHLNNKTADIYKKPRIFSSLTYKMINFSSFLMFRASNLVGLSTLSFRVPFDHPELNLSGSWVATGVAATLAATSQNLLVAAGIGALVGFGIQGYRQAANIIRIGRSLENAAPQAN